MGAIHRHALRLVDGRGIAVIDPAGRQIAGGVALPAFALATHFMDADAAVALMDRPERRPGLNRLQLLRITDQNHLGANFNRMRQNPLQLACADHAGFINHQNVTGGEQIPTLLPAMFHAGDGAGRNARSALKVFRRDSRQGHAANLIARRFPGIACHAEHRALSRSGIADHHTEIVPVGDMRHGLGLFAGEHQTAFIRLPQGCHAVHVLDLMALALRHQFGGAMQTLLGLDHRLRGETIIAASVKTEFNQIGRVTHGPHDLVELINPVTVPMREPRHVPAGESRLLMGDGIQCDGWIGDDPLTVVAGDLTVQFNPVRLKALILDPLRGCTDLALWFECDALCFQAAMVDAGIDIEVGQSLIGTLGPMFAPALDHLGAVPVPHFLPEAVFIDRAHGQHHMGMGFGASVLSDIPMHIEIGDHALINEFRLHEVAGQFDALRLCQLAREVEFALPRELGVFPHFEGLDIVP